MVAKGPGGGGGGDMVGAKVPLVARETLRMKDQLDAPPSRRPPPPCRAHRQPLAALPARAGGSVRHDGLDLARGARAAPRERFSETFQRKACYLQGAGRLGVALPVLVSVSKIWGNDMDRNGSLAVASDPTSVRDCHLIPEPLFFKKTLLSRTDGPICA